MGYISLKNSSVSHSSFSSVPTGLTFNVVCDKTRPVAIVIIRFVIYVRTGFRKYTWQTISTNTLKIFEK